MAKSRKYDPIAPDLPAALAEVFIRKMGEVGISLTIDLYSLVNGFEEALQKHAESIRKDWFWVGEMSYDLETGAGCYLGESLRRQFNGTWLGKIEPNSGACYYRTRIQFGDYLFSPFSWLNYRLSNGREIEGTVETCLAAVYPSMKDGVDYKKRRQEEVIRAGGTVVDKDVY